MREFNHTTCNILVTVFLILLKVKKKSYTKLLNSQKKKNLKLKKKSYTKPLKSQKKNLYVKKKSYIKPLKSQKKNKKCIK